MIPSLFSGSAIPVLEQVASFTEARHNILAGNIANLDTPGYQVRDLSEQGFQARLRAALAARDSAAKAAASGVSPGAISNLLPPGASLLPPPTAVAPVTSLETVNDNLADLLHHDGNNVSLEKQVAEMAKNQLRHNLALTIMTAQFRTLEAAISERA